MSAAAWLWLALVVAVIATIWWMRDWRSQPSSDSVTESPSYEEPQASQPRSDSDGTGADPSGELPVEPAGPVAGDDRPAAPDSSAAADRTPSLPSRGDGVRLAIVIDDLGRSVADARRLHALDSAISFAILPFETKTRQVVEVLSTLGAETLLHLPMQASGPQNPGPGALMLEMERAEIAAATREALQQVGPVVGLNNHMGSAFTENRAAMQPVLEVAEQRGLFFLDSRTSARSVGFSLAREIGLPAAERSVFLDNDADVAAVEAQFDRLLAEGLRSGSAIAIGHPYPSTMKVLERRLPQAIALGFEIVRVSTLLERSSSVF